MGSVGQSRKRPKLFGQSLVASVSQSVASIRQSLVGQTVKGPFKSFDLALLRNYDSNPNFRTIWMHFKESDCDVRLTARSKAVFDEWLQTIQLYDVFVDDGCKRSIDLASGEAPALKNVPEFKARSNLAEIFRS